MRVLKGGMVKAMDLRSKGCRFESWPETLDVSLSMTLNLHCLCSPRGINGSLEVTIKYTCMHRFLAAPYGNSRGHVDVGTCTSPGSDCLYCAHLDVWV